MKKQEINYAAADTFMAIFGYVRAPWCPYCDDKYARKSRRRLPCWMARKRKLNCPKQPG